jgi:signal peptide peptidase SppA
MKYPHFLAYCLSTPWAMEPGAMQTYAAILMQAYARKAGVMAGDHRDDTQYGDDGQPMAKVSGAGRSPTPSIALINVFGTIMQRASDFGPCEGGTGCEDIGAAIDAAMADQSVGQILMRFATPGGSVFGVQELSDKIRAARAAKPIVGIADSFAGSAGYWLLSQCSEAYVTPAGMVGSIGVYTAHEDVSKAMDEAGVKMTFVAAGKYKVEGNPFEPLSDEAKAEIQGRVDAYYKAFTSAIAKGRGVGIDQVRDNMGQGRMLLADDALAAKMVDGVMTFDQVVKKMQSSARQRRPGMASANAYLATQ